MAKTRVRCFHSGEIYAAPMEDWDYPDGYPVVVCPECGARRTLQKVVRSIGRSGSECYENRLIFPFHYRRQQPPKSVEASLITQKKEQLEELCKQCNMVFESDGERFYLMSADFGYRPWWIGTFSTKDYYASMVEAIEEMQWHLSIFGPYIQK